MITSFVYTLFRLYYILIFVRIIISWVPVDPYNDFVRFISKLTDPYLNLFKKIIPPVGMIDFSPIVAIIALVFLENLVFRLLYMFGI